MEQRIVDASVGAKWFFEEKLQEKALHLIEGARQGLITLVVPEIFYVELASVCRKRVRRGTMSAGDAVDTFDRIVELPLTKCSDLELSDVALENALRFGISAYDGLYLALAEVYVSPLVTADETLLKACERKFDFIEALQDFSWKPARKS